MAPQLLNAAALRPLLERRLVIVTGKGGTGKTSVAAALAVAGASSGRRVLVAEVGRDEHLPRLIAPGTAPVGYAGRELLPRLTAARIDPYAALGEYLGIQLHVRSAVELVLRNRAFRQLMDASPGWRELITLGKVWHYEQMRDPSGAPRFDLLVVDAPATGHGISFLDVPRVVVSAVRSGPLRRNAELVEEMIADRDRTLLLPVALAEELPARETAELVAKVRSELRISLDRIVVNALVARPFPPGLEDLDAKLARLPSEPLWPGLPPPPVIAACAAHLRSRYELNRVYLDEIARSTGLPVVPLPFLLSGIRGPEDLRRLAEALLAVPIAEAA
ncbi:MAG TPA: chromosome partitioning protein [Deltaproteobacteria bacterium]|nr:chromosome partitioning protein [Deltaproteobacteria bacterium]